MTVSPGFVERLQKMSAAKREMMLRVPPACLVRAKEGIPLEMPAPGSVAIVSRYQMMGGSTRSTFAPDGELVLILEEILEGPDGKIISRKQGWARESWVDVVGYWRGFSPDAVAGVLSL